MDIGFLGTFLILEPELDFARKRVARQCRDSAFSAPLR